MVAVSLVALSPVIVRAQVAPMCQSSDYRFPADFEPQSAVWLAWPDYAYIGADMAPQEKAELNIIKALVPHVRIKLNIHEADKNHIKNLLNQNNIPLSRITFSNIPYVDIWTRDWGPIYVVNSRGDKKIVDFNWSNWGAPWAFNDPAELTTGEDFDVLAAKQEKLGTIASSIVSEGGDRDFNGKGTMMAIWRTEHQRNPNLTKDQLEAEYKRVLGVKKIVWLTRGVIDDNNPYEGRIPGPDGSFAYTAGGEHIDDTARFADAHTILMPVVTKEEAKRDPLLAENKIRLDEDYQILLHSTDQDNQPFKIVRMPIAETQYVSFPSDNTMYQYIQLMDGHTLDGSTVPYPDPIWEATATNYMNFFVSNGVVLGQKYWKSGMPEIMRQKDEQVASILRSAFPGREVIMLDDSAINIIGGVHCATQQVP
jgi:agmatine deiminase